MLCKKEEGKKLEKILGLFLSVVGIKIYTRLLLLILQMGTIIMNVWCKWALHTFKEKKEHKTIKSVELLWASITSSPDKVQ